MMLAEYLQEVGYHTAGFVGAHFMRGRFGFSQGFDHYQEIVGSGKFRTDAEASNQATKNLPNQVR